ncbi:lipoxygenase family protein [Burkholderia sp. JSH-S8]|nr:lipoxygenase family protein [Burkholderia sp. JSH-S8]
MNKFSDSGKDAGFASARKALENYFATLTGGGAERTAPVELGLAAPGFVFEWLLQDRTYGPPEYADAGVFDETTTPWLDNIHAVPEGQLWTADDLAAMQRRSAQSEQEAAYARDHRPSPGQPGPDPKDYIARAFTVGMYDPEVFTPDQIARLTSFWVADDAEFARQRLGAANPDVMRLFTEPDSTLEAILHDSTGAHDMPKLLDRLKRANNAGRELFRCDYRPILGPLLDNNRIRNGQYLAVPQVFFTRDGAGRALTPQAIQLKPHGYWFTPDDGPNAWLLAKLHVASADAQWWFSGTHLFSTHSIVMIFSIATQNLLAQQKLDPNHPIVKLVAPHLKKVFDINNAVYNLQGGQDGRGIYSLGQFCDAVLPGGRIGVYETINAFYVKYGGGYAFSDNSFPTELQIRGMDQQQFDGEFPYRDDALPWWHAIAHFTSAIVDATYATDAELAADRAIKDWMDQITQAFNHGRQPNFFYGGTKGELAAVLATLLFLATAKHTAVNNTMLDAYGFIPNGAFAMNAAPPTQPDVTADMVIRSLPDPFDLSDPANTVLPQIGFVMAGTADVDYRIWGDGSAGALQRLYGYDPVSQPKQVQAVNGYHDGLTNVNAQIQRNRQRRIDNYVAQGGDRNLIPNSVIYPYLSVDQVMACIQI